MKRWGRSRMVRLGMVALALAGAAGVAGARGGGASGAVTRARWSQITSAAPFQFNGDSIAYDRQHNQLVALGGAATATFDGNTWTVVTTYDDSILVVADEANGLVYKMVTSENGQSQLCAVPWAGTAWGTPLCTAALPPPPPLVYWGIELAAYDPTHQALVVVAGKTEYLGNGSSTSLGTWTLEFDGQGWTTLAPAHEPLFAAYAVKDDANGTVVAPMDNSPDTWVWDGVDWHRVYANAEGHALWLQMQGQGGSHATLAYDPRSKTVVQVGMAGDEQNRRVWQWDGASWKLVAATGLSPSGGPIAYDPQMGAVVMLGVSDGAVPLGSTSGDSTTWQLLWGGSLP